MIIMSIDYGRARTGIAVCDKDEVVASPVTTIKEYNMDSLAEKVAELAREKKAQELVLGLPRNMDGSEGESAANVRVFREKLMALCDIPVTLRDERCTTVTAYEYLNMNNKRGKKRKEVVDSVAAVIILEDYLSYRRNRS